MWTYINGLFNLHFNKIVLSNLPWCLPWKLRTPAGWRLSWWGKANLRYTKSTAAQTASFSHTFGRWRYKRRRTRNKRQKMQPQLLLILWLSFSFFFLNALRYLPGCLGWTAVDPSERPLRARCVEKCTENVQRWKTRWAWEESRTRPCQKRWSSTNSLLTATAERCKRGRKRRAKRTTLPRRTIPKARPVSCSSGRRISEASWWKRSDRTSKPTGCQWRLCTGTRECFAAGCCQTTTRHEGTGSKNIPRRPADLQRPKTG